MFLRAIVHVHVHSHVFNPPLCVVYTCRIVHVVYSEVHGVLHVYMVVAVLMC